MYNPDNARTEAQKDRMQELASEGICLFCEPQDSFIEGDHWCVRENDYPYEHTSHHFLVIAKEHVKSIKELLPEAREEFLLLVSMVEQRYNLTSYGVGLRSGDIQLNGGTVEHLHAHIIVGDGQETVRFKVSSPPEEREVV